jgi:hypothetical protein
MKEINVTEEEAEVKNDEQPAVTEDDYPAGTLRSGTTYRDIAAASLAQFILQLTQAEENYLNYMKECNEIECVGAGIGGGFEHTTELHVMKFDAAMKSRDAAHWKKSVEEEYSRMEDNEVWSPVPKSVVPQDAKILTSTWAMKKKSNGTYRARLNG